MPMTRHASSKPDLGRDLSDAARRRRNEQCLARLQGADVANAEISGQCRCAERPKPVVERARAKDRAFVFGVARRIGCDCQPVRPCTRSPGAETVRLAAQHAADTASAHDFPDGDTARVSRGVIIQDRMAGSIEINMVSTSNSPVFRSGTVAVSESKCSGPGMPAGRALSMTRWLSMADFSPFDAGY